MKNRRITQQQQIEDKQHLRAGYVLLNEALNEFHRVYNKDNIVAHTIRVIGAIADTLYDYVGKKGA